jgi:tetratricopeptide (TPR) repeat protein
MFFFIAIFPAMGVIGFTNVIASDKFAYLPSLGLMLPLVYFLGRLWNGEVLLSAERGRAVIILTVMVLAGLEFNATRRYLTKWKDTETLMKHMLAMTPQSASLNNGMGHFLFKDGKVDEAILYYRKALSINPHDSGTQQSGCRTCGKGPHGGSVCSLFQSCRQQVKRPCFL